VRYQSKPYPIEAIQFTCLEDYNEMAARWGILFEDSTMLDAVGETILFEERRSRAKIGDFIVKNLKHNIFFSLPPNEFHDAYEAVKEPTRDEREALCKISEEVK